MPDHDGYPTTQELQAILDFEGTPAEFVDYINSIWWYDGFTIKNGRDDFKRGVKRCYLSTWGWSGNEEIVSVLQQTWFWMLYWQESRRGGHYTFEVSTKQAWNNKLSVGSFGMPHSKVER